MKPYKRYVIVYLTMESSCTDLNSLCFYHDFDRATQMLNKDKKLAISPAANGQYPLWAALRNPDTSYTRTLLVIKLLSLGASIFQSNESTTKTPKWPSVPLYLVIAKGLHFPILLKFFLILFWGHLQDNTVSNHAHNTSYKNFRSYDQHIMSLWNDNDNQKKHIQKWMQEHNIQFLFKKLTDSSTCLPKSIHTLLADLSLNALSDTKQVPTKYMFIAFFHDPFSQYVLDPNKYNVNAFAISGKHKGTTLAWATVCGTSKPCDKLLKLIWLQKNGADFNIPISPISKSNRIGQTILHVLTSTNQAILLKFAILYGGLSIPDASGRFPHDYLTITDYDRLLENKVYNIYNMLEYDWPDLPTLWSQDINNYLQQHNHNVQLPHISLNSPLYFIQ